MSRQTRRNTTTEKSIDSTHLDPWSDDSCRDYLVRRTIECIDERVETGGEWASQVICERFNTIYGAASPVSSLSQRQGSAAQPQLLAMGASPTSPADGIAPTPEQQRKPTASAEKGGDVTPSPTAKRIPFEDEPTGATTSTGGSQALGSGLAVALAASPQLGSAENPPAPSPAQPLPDADSSPLVGSSRRAQLSHVPATVPPGPVTIDVVKGHISSLKSRGIVIDRFSIKDLQFISFMLRGPEAFVPRSREGALMDMRTFYYETLKTPKTAEEEARERRQRAAEAAAAKEPTETGTKRGEKAAMPEPARRMTRAAAAAAAAEQTIAVVPEEKKEKVGPKRKRGQVEEEETAKEDTAPEPPAKPIDKTVAGGRGQTRRGANAAEKPSVADVTKKASLPVVDRAAIDTVVAASHVQRGLVDSIPVAARWFNNSTSTPAGPSAAAAPLPHPRAQIDRPRKGNQRFVGAQKLPHSFLTMALEPKEMPLCATPGEVRAVSAYENAILLQQEQGKPIKN